MSAPANGIIVTLEEDASSDWAKILVQSIRAMKGVIAAEVVPENIDTDVYLARMQVKSELRQKLFDVLK